MPLINTRAYRMMSHVSHVEQSFSQSSRMEIEKNSLIDLPQHSLTLIANIVLVG